MEQHSGGGRTGQGEPQDELAAVRELRAKLEALPALEAPAGLWSRIEDRLVASGIAGTRGEASIRPRRVPWLRSSTLRVAGIAAVFVIGLGLGRLTVGGGAVDEVSPPQVSSAQPGELTVAEAFQEVRRLGAQYDAALGRLDIAAARTGTQFPSLAQERLAALNLLVEASRAALAAEPADPDLNAYLFAALEQRDNVMRQIGQRSASESGSGVVWR